MDWNNQQNKSKLKNQHIFKFEIWDDHLQGVDTNNLYIKNVDQI